jgi:hypothetical protein
MTSGELVGTIGVTLLLLAFALNLAGRLSTSSTLYLVLNVVGAALAGVSSYMINFWPFVILEGVWMVSSLIILLKRKTNDQTTHS